MIDLQKFCARSSDDPRQYLYKPFMCKFGATASNGHTAIAVREMQVDHDGTGMPKGFPQAVERYLDRTVSNWIALSSITIPPIECEQCWYCKGQKRGSMIQCDSCDGDGYFFHHGYQYDCHNCVGNGEFFAPNESDPPCVNCDGRGEVARREQTMQVGNAWFNPEYLSWVAELPNAEISPDGQDSALFRFDGGIGVLMPMRPPK